jgi:hypothetical protein
MLSPYLPMHRDVNRGSDIGYNPGLKRLSEMAYVTNEISAPKNDG